MTAPRRPCRPCNITLPHYVTSNVTLNYAPYPPLTCNPMQYRYTALGRYTAACACTCDLTASSERQCHPIMSYTHAVPYRPVLYFGRCIRWVIRTVASKSGDVRAPESRFMTWHDMDHVSKEVASFVGKAFPPLIQYFWLILGKFTQMKTTYGSDGLKWNITWDMCKSFCFSPRVKQTWECECLPRLIVS